MPTPTGPIKHAELIQAQRDLAQAKKTYGAEKAKAVYQAFKNKNDLDMQMQQNNPAGQSALYKSKHVQLIVDAYVHESFANAALINIVQRVVDLEANIRQADNL